MFNLFKAKPTEPVILEAEIDIEANIETVFAALDPAHDQNGLVQRGWTVAPDAEDPGLLRAVDPNMPDLAFLFDVVEREAPYRLVMHTRFADGAIVGNLEEGRSAYALIDRGEAGCRVAVLEESHLAPGLGRRQREQEEAMLAVAVHDDLARLKALIEDGPEAAETAGALDDLFAALEDLSCGGAEQHRQ
ncbi:MAG: SRPBCC family protein [Pseudomonadota bacterium]